MISVEEARNIIAAQSSRLAPIKKSISESAGQILAKDVFAFTDIPSFRQSSMDGYAIKFNDKQQILQVSGTMMAGSSNTLHLQKGNAVRIFTGAPLPNGADTVVMQEKVKREGDTIVIEDSDLTEGKNVRNKGAEIKSGDMAMQEGTLLTAAAIGFLSGIGISEIYVYPSPSISIIITGNEIQEPGVALEFGQVYDANSFQLKAALQAINVFNITTWKVNDNPDALKKVLEQALERSDMVLLTGGVSVGDYDYVVQATSACNITQHFHKIKQRPGKPLFFGSRGKKPVFGLPGNPSSVLSCFYMYVMPCISLLSGRDNRIKKSTAVLSEEYKKPKGLTCFLKGFEKDGTVKALGAQESFRLSSFAQANCLIELDEEREAYEANETVTIHLLTFS
jgi:molybdopterin molybdotransferase